MHKFDHPNVLKLTGVCLDGGPAPYIIMPFMTNGSLLSYLKKEREHVLIEPESAACQDVVSSVACIGVHIFYSSSHGYMFHVELCGEETTGHVSSSG